MALLKELTNDMGIIANYHKIESVVNHTGKVTVVVNSYAAQEYREKESVQIRNHERLFEIGALLSKLCLKPEEDRSDEEKDQIEALVSEENEIAKNYSGRMEYKVFDKQYTFDFSNEDISFENIYNKLKETDDFKDAMDVL